MRDVVICQPLRTPVGRFGGVFRDLDANTLATGLLTALVERTGAHGGFVSYRSNGDGTQSPYELNITWYSALNREGSGEPQTLQVDRFLAARAIALAMRSGATIRGEEAVLAEAGIAIPDEQEDEVEKFREFLDTITPEDFEQES